MFFEHEQHAQRVVSASADMCSRMATIYPLIRMDDTRDWPPGQLESPHHEGLTLARDVTGV
jgi:hypothetical protein